MGHRHHRRHKGCGGCGSCEVCIPGIAVPGFGPMGFARAGLRFGQEVLAPVAPAMDVMAANGQILATSPYGGAPLMAPPPPTYNQFLMTQYAAMRSAAGFPVAAIAAPIGFKAKKVRRKKTRDIIARPGTFFTGKAIFISKCVAKHFDICSLRVGQLYVIGGRDPVPAEMLANSDCGGCLLPLPPVGPCDEICLTVKNRDCKHSHWFRAGIQGVTLV